MLVVVTSTWPVSQSWDLSRQDGYHGVCQEPQAILTRIIYFQERSYLEAPGHYLSFWLPGCSTLGRLLGELVVQHVLMAQGMGL